MNDLENVTYRRLAILLIAIGVILAVDAFLGYSAAYKLWPVLILLPGIGFIGIFVKQKGRGALYLAIGEYLILFMGLALYCNFTSWRNLARIWPVFVTFFAIVLLSMFIFHHRNRFLFFLGLLLLFLSLFFFLVFSIGAQYWWAIFILVGLSILLSGKLK
ncbi:MAG: hypothetical protein ACYS8W_07480 [Planctomycetota bacterium]|jgi:hypothetical protein